MELSDITFKARWYHFISRLKENDFSLPNIEFNDITSELSDITLEYLGDITLELSDGAESGFNSSTRIPH